MAAEHIPAKLVCRAARLLLLILVLLLMAAQAISHRLSPTARLVLQRGDLTRF